MRLDPRHSLYINTYCGNSQIFSPLFRKPPKLSEQIAEVLSDVLYSVEGKIMSEIPRLTPLMLSAGFKILKNTTSKTEVTPIPWAIFFQDGLDIAHAYDMEFDFPFEDADYSPILKALNVYIRLLKKYAHGK